MAAPLQASNALLQQTLAMYQQVGKRGDVMPHEGPGQLCPFLVFQSEELNLTFGARAKARKV